MALTNTASYKAVPIFNLPHSSLRYAVVAALMLLGSAMANASEAGTLKPAPADVLAQQRQLYTEALELASRGKWQQLRQQRRQLQTYPLYPYLIYADLSQIGRAHV